MDELGGLPAHPLLVHIPVVLVPLALIGVVLALVRPKLMPVVGPIVATLSGVGFLGTLLAANSGEELEEQFKEAGETISGTLKDHVELGDTAQFLVGLFFLATLAWVLFAWWRNRAGEEAATAKVRKPKVVAIVLTVLTLGFGTVATWSIVATGHNGAKSVWEEEG